MRTMRTVRLAMLGLAVLAVAVVAVLWLRPGGETDQAGATVVDHSSRPGWKTIEFHGARVDIPAGWERLDQSGCEFQGERWAQPETPACEFEQGAAFFGAATFDAAEGPGVRQTTENGHPTWGGYADAGRWIVYVADPDRDIVASALDSVRG